MRDEKWLNVQGECSRWLTSLQNRPRTTLIGQTWGGAAAASTFFPLQKCAERVRKLLSGRVELTCSSQQLTGQTTAMLKFDQNFTGSEEIFCVTWLDGEKVKFQCVYKPQGRTDKNLFKWSWFVSLCSCAFYEFHLCSSLVLSKPWPWCHFGLYMCVKIVWKKHFKVQFKDPSGSTKLFFWLVVFEI